MLPSTNIVCFTDVFDSALLQPVSNSRVCLSSDVNQIATGELTFTTELMYICSLLPHSCNILNGCR